MEHDMQIIERLARVEEKIDSLLDRTIYTGTRVDDHETRIRLLEQSGAKILGMGTIIAAISGIAGTRIMDIFVG